MVDELVIDFDVGRSVERAAQELLFNAQRPFDVKDVQAPLEHLDDRALRVVRRVLLFFARGDAERHFVLADRLRNVAEFHGQFVAVRGRFEDRRADHDRRLAGDDFVQRLHGHVLIGIAGDPHVAGDDQFILDEHGRIDVEAGDRHVAALVGRAFLPEPTVNSGTPRSPSCRAGSLGSGVARLEGVLAAVAEQNHPGQPMPDLLVQRVFHRGADGRLRAVGLARPNRNGGPSRRAAQRPCRRCRTSRRDRR